jgi:hypothetical protein|tara:strand:- start:303 stop:716 length:414 start_codon:yes stop_codon:yes gene_type:complete
MVFSGALGCTFNGMLAMLVVWRIFVLCCSWLMIGEGDRASAASEFERKRSSFLRLLFHCLLLASAVLQIPQQARHLTSGFDTQVTYMLHMLADQFFLISVSLVVLQWALLSTEVLQTKKRGHVYMVLFMLPNVVILR